MAAVWKVVIKNNLKLSPTTLLLVLVKPEAAARAWGEPLAGILVLLTSVATLAVTVHYNKLSQFP